MWLCQASPKTDQLFPNEMQPIRKTSKLISTNPFTSGNTQLDVSKRLGTRDATLGV